MEKKGVVPIWEKSNLTLEEAAAYSGIGINKLRESATRKTVILCCGWAPSACSSAKSWIVIWRAATRCKFA